MASPPFEVDAWLGAKWADGDLEVRLTAKIVTLLYGKNYHPLGLSGSHVGCAVLSYSPSALETLGGEPRSLSEPPDT